MSWTTVLTSIGTTVAGGGAVQYFHAWRGHRRTDAENRRDEAMADGSVVDAAVKLLEPYRKEVNELRVELAGLKTEMEIDRREQARVVGLLQQAVTVIRDFLTVAREHNWAAPKMSHELLAEIDKAG